MTGSRARTWITLALLAGALAAFALASAPLQLFTGSSDPSFYLAYVNDYRAVAARFGQTYHGNRLAYVLVDAVAFRMFGPELGYFVARWGALSLAAFLLGLVAVRRAGRDAALLVIALVVLLPWLTRQLLWTHYDGFSAVYVAIAAAIAVLRPRSPQWMLLAGVALAFAVNTNLAVIFVVVSFGLAWLIAQRTAGLRPLVRLTLALVAGFVMGQGALSLLLRTLVGVGPFYVEQVALDVAFRLAGDDTWFVPVTAALRGSPYLLVLPVLVLALSLAVRAVGEIAGPEGGAIGRETRALAEFALAWVLLLVPMVLVLHGVFQHGWFSGSYYNVHFFVPVLLMVIALLATVRRPDQEAHPSDTVGLLAMVVLLMVAWAWTSRPLAAGIGIAGAAAVALLVVVARPDVLRRQTSFDRTRLVPVLVSGVLLVLWASPAQVPASDGFASMSQRNALEWDVFAHQLAVQRIVEETTAPEERLMFWHTTVMPQGEWMTRINMVYYGTGQGRLHTKRDPVGMPDLPFDISGELLDVRPLNLVLISPDGFEVEAGLLALRSRGLDPQVAHRQVLEGDVIDLHVLLVRLG